MTPSRKKELKHAKRCRVATCTKKKDQASKQPSSLVSGLNEMGAFHIKKSHQLFREGDVTLENDIPGRRGNRKKSKCCGCV